MYMHVFISWNNEILHLPCQLPTINAVIYIVVEFDKELGVNGSTMEIMPDN